MPYAIREHPGMTLIGLTARTDNATESGGQGAIPATWDKLVQGNILNRIAASSAADEILRRLRRVPERCQRTVHLPARRGGHWRGRHADGAHPQEHSRRKVRRLRRPHSRPGCPPLGVRSQGVPLRRRYLGDFEIYSRHDPTLPVEIFVGIE